MSARHHDHSVTPRLLRDRLWHELTIAANRAFENGGVEQAGKLYRQALAEAEKLFSAQDMTKTVIPLPAIINIAFHNLAQFTAQNGDENECTGLLIRAFELLVGSALQPATPLVLRLSCIQHLKYTLAELV